MYNKEIRDKIEVELRLGKPIVLISKETGVARGTIRSVATNIGWDFSWRKKEYRQTPHNVNQNTDEILRRYDSGERQIHIAGDYRISRERVRQIIKANGRESARNKARKINEQKVRQYREMLEARRATEQQKFEDRWSLARKMWDEGKKVPEIAKAYGSKEDSMWVRVCTLRKQFGWFPKRKFTITDENQDKVKEFLNVIK
jgi:Mor family transcriptional regulator